MQTKATMRYYHTHIRKVKIKKTYHTKCCPGCRVIRTDTLMFLKKFLKKLNMFLHMTQYFISRYYPREMKDYKDHS